MRILTLLELENQLDCIIREKLLQIIEVVPFLEHTDIFIQVFFIKLYVVQLILVYFNNLQGYSTFRLIEFMQE